MNDWPNPFCHATEVWSHLTFWTKTPIELHIFVSYLDCEIQIDLFQSKLHVPKQVIDVPWQNEHVSLLIALESYNSLLLQKLAGVKSHLIFLQESKLPLDSIMTDRQVRDLFLRGFVPTERRERDEYIKWWIIYWQTDPIPKCVQATVNLAITDFSQFLAVCALDFKDQKMITTLLTDDPRGLRLALLTRKEGKEDENALFSIQNIEITTTDLKRACAQSRSPIQARVIRLFDLVFFLVILGMIGLQTFVIWYLPLFLASIWACFIFYYLLWNAYCVLFSLLHAIHNDRMQEMVYEKKLLQNTFKKPALPIYVGTRIKGVVRRLLASLQ